MKYIVYLTTNIVNKKIYVGVHKTETPETFDHYLGCGIKDNDAYTYKYSKTPFEAAVNKYGPSKFIRKVLKTFDKLEDALDLERWLVDEDFIARKDTYNVVLGGGIPPIKVKTIYQYDLEGNFIKQWSSITEAALHFKCSNSCIGKAIFDRMPSLKYLWADYKSDKLNLNDFKIGENKKKTYLYDINGYLINTFDSISECANYIDSTIGNISNIIKGQYCFNKKYYISNIKYDLFPIPKLDSHKNCPVYQYDLQGNFLNKWNTHQEAINKYGKTLNISKAIRLGGQSIGFQCSWQYLPKLKCLKQITKARKVGKYDLNNNLIQVFNTVREAKKDTCGAPNVLKGNRKTAGGYIWKYIED